MPPSDTRESRVTRRDLVLAWYRKHPGFHRCLDVATALGQDTHAVAVSSRVLWERGDIQRVHADRQGKRPQALYGINPTQED